MLVFKLLLSVPQFVVTLLPASIMAFYFAQLARGHHETNRPERAGDNIYYLGFLFTLVSLGLALFEFGVNSEEKTGLIADFAIALSTTIFGVLGRVWLIQGDKEIDEYEKEAKLHVADAIDELRKDLERSRETMVEFASVTRQVLEENRDEQRKQMDQDREAFEEHFRNTLEKMGEVLSTAVTTGSEKLSEELERLATNISAQVGVFTGNVESLNSASTKLSTSLSSAVSAFQAMPDPTELIEEKLQAIVRPLETASKRMVSILQKQQGWAEKSAECVNEVVTSLDAIGVSIAQVGESSNDFMAKLKSPVDSVLDRVSRVEVALTSIVRQLEGLQSVTDAIEQTPQSLNRSMESLDVLGKTIGEVTEKVAGSLNSFHREIERARDIQNKAISGDTETLGRLAIEREHVIKGLSNTNRELATQVDHLRGQLGAMSEALIGAAKFVSQEAGSAS